MADTEKDSGQLEVGDLCRMFEEAEESTYLARQEAERDRDYYDHKQYTAEEEATLRKRKQPIVKANRIQPKINFLVGLEKSKRIDPKAFPRTPQHEQDADGASQALKYVADEQNYDSKRSAVWKDMLIEGAGGISVAVEPSYRDEMCVKLQRIAWDRMFWDPHSAEHDFSDASYIGVVIWMDYDEAVAKYPDAKDALDNTLASAPSETYDDKPKWNLWADRKRKRVRICQIWLRRQDEWHWAEFTKGGILNAGPSPYRDDKGESDCGLFFQSAYVDRDNNRYGLVRIMISLQDEINKRRSKALHLLNTAQTVYEDGAVDDIEHFRREAAKPDGTMRVAPNALMEKRVQFNTRVDLAQGQVELLQESKNELDQIGPNATMMGEKAQGSSSASGKAIIASQQGGMMEVGDLLDHLHNLDMRVFRAIWGRIRQFWTGEKWIRVTDDERNVKWIGMNVDPMQMQMAMQQNPDMQGRIAGLVQSVAELDCDIIIDEAPDSVTPALEQWQGLVELAKAGIPIPPDVLIEAAPNLKNKDKLLERMNQPNPAARAMQQLEVAGAKAEVEETQSRTILNRAKAQEAMTPDAPEMGEPGPSNVEVAETLAGIQDTRAATGLKIAQTRKVMVDTALAPQKMQSDQRMKQAQLQQRAQQMKRQVQRPAA